MSLNNFFVQKLQNTELVTDSRVSSHDLPFKMANSAATVLPLMRNHGRFLLPQLWPSSWAVTICASWVRILFPSLLSAVDQAVLYQFPFCPAKKSVNSADCFFSIRTKNTPIPCLDIHDSDRCQQVTKSTIHGATVQGTLQDFHRESRFRLQCQIAEQLPIQDPGRRRRRPSPSTSDPGNSRPKPGSCRKPFG